MIIEDKAGNVELLEFYHILRRFIQQDEHSLTIRQLAVFLTCYLLDEDHTVRRLAARFDTAKPAISRILDHLVDEGLIERRADPRDRRSVLFGRTPAGKMFLENIQQLDGRRGHTISAWRPGAPQHTRR